MPHSATVVIPSWLGRILTPVLVALLIASVGIAITSFVRLSTLEERVLRHTMQLDDMPTDDDLKAAEKLSLSRYDEIIRRLDRIEDRIN